ncbi:MAG: FAD-dependent oxidoreductase [Pseudomonadota bacterium]
MACSIDVQPAARSPNLAPEVDAFVLAPHLVIMNSPSSQMIFDLCIVGAGPVGSTLALVAAREGLSVALVDARDPAAPKPRDGRNFAIVEGGWNLLSAAGIAQELDQSTEFLNGLEATDDARHWFGAPTTLFTGDDLGGDDGKPLGRMVEAETLQAALDAAVSQSLGIELIAPATFTTAQYVDGRIDALLAGGRLVKARLLVGCDGLNSAVRHWARIGVEGRSYGKSVFAANVALSQPHGGIARQLFTPEGPFATLPLRGDRANLAWYMKSGAAEALAARPVEEIEVELNARFARFAGDMQIDGKHISYPLKLQIARSMAADRVALVGDAARRINPLAGQGLNLGLKDVAALCEVCADQVKVGLDPGSSWALERYSRWRHFDANATALAMDAVDRIYSNDNALLKPLRGAALIAADRIGPLREMLARQASASQDHLPRLMKGI